MKNTNSGGEYTAQLILKDLRTNHPIQMEEYYVGAKDRKYQVWERNPLSIELWTEDVVKQKLGYIHQNPVHAGLVKYAEDYTYSSARAYLGEQDQTGVLTLCYF